MDIARVSLFLIGATLFAAAHLVAIELSLYWYYWWFDVPMHLWGGALIAFGVYVLAPISPVPLRPTTGLVLLALLSVTVAWEVFERLAGLYDPASYVFDTSKDIIVGFAGGLLAHVFLRKRYNKTT